MRAFAVWLVFSLSFSAFAQHPTPPKPRVKDKGCQSACSKEVMSCVEGCGKLTQTPDKPMDDENEDDAKPSKKKSPSKPPPKASDAKSDVCASKCAQDSAPCFKECK